MIPNSDQTWHACHHRVEVQAPFHFWGGGHNGERLVGSAWCYRWTRAKISWFIVVLDDCCDWIIKFELSLCVFILKQVFRLLRFLTSIMLMKFHVSCKIVVVMRRLFKSAHTAFHINFNHLRSSIYVLLPLSPRSPRCDVYGGYGGKAGDVMAKDVFFFSETRHCRRRLYYM